MNNGIKEFIEQNIDLIENNDFDLLYNKINSYKFTTMFSEALIKAGINPLNHMSYVPTRYLYESLIDNIDIPSNIERISKYAFARCYGLSDVVLPEGLKFIDEGAFMNCCLMESITLPSTLEVIDFGAFQGCAKLAILHFRGTVDQWLNVNEKDDSLRGSAHRIICSDGIFDFE